MSKEFKKVVTPKFRVSFPNVFKPTSFQGGDPFYTLTMLFDKDTDISELKKLANLAKVEKFGANPPKGLRSPFRDGDEKDFDGYEGVTFISAKSKSKPGLVDQDLQEIIDPEAFYAGCYARATITAYGYDTRGNKGVAFGLQNIQKLGDGEPFSGKTKAKDDFSAVERDENFDDDEF